jgi:hypothetical protein
MVRAHAVLDNSLYRRHSPALAAFAACAKLFTQALRHLKTSPHKLFCFSKVSIGQHC